MNEILQMSLHLYWADARLLDALEKGGAVPAAFREFAHVIGSEETWLARIEGRAPRCAVWPDLPVSDVRGLMEETHAAYRGYLSELTEEGLEKPVSYTNSAGRQFTNNVGEILLHVALHAQYHRGKVNFLLRQAGQPPSPTDFIAFTRGAPAATEATARKDQVSD